MKDFVTDFEGFLDFMQEATGVPAKSMRAGRPLRPILSVCPNCRHAFAGSQERIALNALRMSERAGNFIDIDIAGKWGSHPGALFSIKCGAEPSAPEQLMDFARLAKPEVGVYQVRWMDCDVAPEESLWQVHKHV